eukprot:COSAG01_NODE_2269_length_8033_cov_30.452609_6_plen_223_part_00
MCSTSGWVGSWPSPSASTLFACTSVSTTGDPLSPPVTLRPLCASLTVRSSLCLCREPVELGPERKPSRPAHARPALLDRATVPCQSDSQAGGVRGGDHAAAGLSLSLSDEAAASSPSSSVGPAGPCAVHGHSCSGRRAGYSYGLLLVPRDTVCVRVRVRVCRGVRARRKVSHGFSHPPPSLNELALLFYLAIALPPNITDRHRLLRVRGRDIVKRNSAIGQN